MLRWLVVLSVSTVATSCSSDEDVLKAGRKPSCACGWLNKSPDYKIVGGTYYEQNEYPFIARLARVPVYGRRYTPFCGGSIITPNHVLTAAHCTDSVIRARAKTAVLLGTHDLSRPVSKAVAIAVRSIRQHKQWSAKNLKNDIAVLVLSKSIEYNTIIGPACMPLPGLDVTGKAVTILGWGARKFQGMMTTTPKKLETTVIMPYACFLKWKDEVDSLRPTRPTHICTQSRKETPCQGDSGGPVVWLDPTTNRYTLVGIVSFGQACSDEKPAVHTKVEAYINWIERQISGSQMCTN